ncbi:unnamed protein product [Kuraishia capsulata CBS 1993]|uniref:Peptidase S26 domain-containing protein n=1 Tax=Kuraishia capsulata CBS 1993 TaxID=1382522 RepID=W6MQJ8_9ASCO|nr:uncharacterized protein KUCA_T00004995001 [Kuraishia capsulata CBS 1993]CDK29009.1 unnamed protein product [Kuraishia capsulata CBS 1993]
MSVISKSPFNNYPDPTQTAPPMSETLIYMRTLASWILKTGCAIHYVHSNVYELKESRGESMLTTLNTSFDYVHTLKTYQNGNGVKNGDVIVALKPIDPHQRVCKRITGMPGDVIIIDPSNGSTHGRFESKYMVVPEGHCWVTGDNLSHSLDSRSYSVIPLGLIKGKIVAANDFNGSWRSLWGFRWIENAFVKE